MTGPPDLAALTAPDGPFPIREQTILGVTGRAYDCGPWTLTEVLAQTTAFAERDYVVFEHERYTFADHLDIVAGLAHHLASEYGIGPGDRVALAMRNYPEFVFHFWATLALGGVVVPFNAWWTEPELRHGLEDSGAVLLVVDDERLERMRPILAKVTSLRGTISVRTAVEVPGVTRFADIRAVLPTGLALPATEIDPDQLAVIMYTSGTTGRSMGVAQTHRNHCTNLINTKLLGSAGFARPADPNAPVVINGAVVHMPLFHISGLASMHISAAAGSKIVLMRKFDAELLLELIERERLTSLTGVPMQAQSLFDSPSLATRDLSSLQTLGFAGTAIAPEMVLRVRRAFGGRVFARTSYGMTEATSAVTFITGQEYWDYPDSVGRAAPVNDIRIVDSDGNDVPYGQPGEVWVRGPNIVAGYWNQPEATARAFVGGWHRSGDVGTLDEQGRLRIVDRIKDVVIRAGENVYCGQVEAVLAEHPAVRAAIVLGLPHERLGEEVAAVVALNAGHEQTTAEELQAHAGQQLAYFKVPSRFVFITGDVPRTATGKVLKRAIRERITPAGEWIAVANDETAFEQRSSG